MADALSRRNWEDQPSQAMAITGVVPTWVQDILFSYEGDESIQSIIQ